MCAAVIASYAPSNEWVKRLKRFDIPADIVGHIMLFYIISIRAQRTDENKLAKTIKKPRGTYPQRIFLFFV